MYIYRESGVCVLTVEQLGIQSNLTPTLLLEGKRNHAPPTPPHPTPPPSDLPTVATPSQSLLLYSHPRLSLVTGETVTLPVVSSRV